MLIIKASNQSKHTYIKPESTFASSTASVNSDWIAWRHGIDNDNNEESITRNKTMKMMHWSPKKQKHYAIILRYFDYIVLSSVKNVLKINLEKKFLSKACTAF